MVNLGLDFDNTLINYDSLFKKVAFEQQLIPKDFPESKKLNTDIWYEENTYLWVKAAFEKTGYWEYRIKNVK